MQSFLSPDLIQRHHEHRVEEALRRNLPAHDRHARDTGSAGGYVIAFRRRLGQWLIAAGTQVAPARPAVTRRPQVGDVAVAGSADW